MTKPWSIHRRAEVESRTYRVAYKRDFHPGSDLHWRVHFYGAGHWCRYDGQQHAFRTKEFAEAAGRAWVATGRTDGRVDVELLAKALAS